MRIGIAAATQMEIQPAIDFFQENTGLLRSHELETVITGVGSMSASYNISRFILDRRPLFIVQAGIGGTFTEQFKPGSVVLIREEILGDLGAEEKEEFHDVFDLGLIDPSTSPYTHKRLINPYLAQWKQFEPFFARAVTVNEITTRADRIRLLIKKYECEIESMEGAAFHFICLQEKVQFIQLRAVSNYIGERDKEKWKLKQAIENLNKELINIVQQILNP